MRRLGLVFLCAILIFSIFVTAQNEITSPTDATTLPQEQTSSQIATKTTTPEQTTATPERKPEEKQEFDVDPGITPDSILYIVDDLAERVLVGDNPERALDYREEKIAEARAMVEEGKPEEARRVLDRAMQYGDVVEREVSPDIQRRVEESSDAVSEVLNDMRAGAEGEGWQDVNDKLDENIEKGKKLGTAAELSAKISELCQALAKLDSLQYADTCKAGGNSPKWMKEADKQLTKEQEQQAKIFFEKLSVCFENPKNCDCKGMGIQKFEDFCLEKSALAVKCEGGDEEACRGLDAGEPIDLLPDYLVPIFKKVESRFMGAKFDRFAPPECVKAGAKTPEECNQIMFKLNAPEECIKAGLTGKSREDEIKCRNIMFESNTPKECTDAGIKSEDKDAPRKCSKIMFQQRAPQECIDAGITGEARDDEKKCKELMKGKDLGGEGPRPQFNRDCKAIQDTTEKVKCYEEFYNNAQSNIKDDFRQPTKQEGFGGQKCPDSICDDFEKRNPGACPVDCGGSCQSQQQIENLKQDCKNRGQDARVEDRGGCSWVVCVGGAQQGQMINQINKVERVEQGQINTGQKCPDGNCDDYERMNPWACPEDCGGTRQPGNYPQQQPGDYQQPNQQQGQEQNQQQFCSGQAPSCAPNGAPFCENGNWRCPQPPEQVNRIDQPIQPPFQEPQVQQPIEQQPQVQEPTTTTTPESGGTTTTGESSSSSGGGESSAPTTPTTGGVITGRVIVSNYGDESTRSGDGFLDYWFGR